MGATTPFALPCYGDDKLCTGTGKPHAREKDVHTPSQHQLWFNYTKPMLTLLHQTYTWCNCVQLHVNNVWGTSEGTEINSAMPPYHPHKPSIERYLLSVHIYSRHAPNAPCQELGQKTGWAFHLSVLPVQVTGRIWSTMQPLLMSKYESHQAKGMKWKIKSTYHTDLYIQMLLMSSFGVQDCKGTAAIHSGSWLIPPGAISTNRTKHSLVIFHIIGSKGIHYKCTAWSCWWMARVPAQPAMDGYIPKWNESSP